MPIQVDRLSAKGLNNALFADQGSGVSSTNKIDNAFAALGGAGVVLAARGMASGGPSAAFGSGLFIDYRGTDIPSNTLVGNSIAYNVNTGGNTKSMIRTQMTANAVAPLGSIVANYLLTSLTNATVTGGVVDGASTEAQVTGTLSGTLPILCGNESVATVTSTGGAITNAFGTIGYVFNTLGSTTAITNAYGVWGRGCNGTISGTPPVNAYGLYGSEQFAIASSKNYSLGIEGRGLLRYSNNQGAGGLDLEDHTGVARHFITMNSTDNTQIQEAVAGQGLFLQDSTGANQLVVTAAGLRVAGAFRLAVAAPSTTAGQVGLGSTVASTVGAAGAASALPATPLGYWIVNVAGTQVKIPYYNN